MATEHEGEGRGIPVSLPVFEGPLDLLLHLIEKNKIDIYDIPIMSITGQYMDYIRQMEKTDLGVMSEFLVMAATLLEIKARMLLPAEVDEEGEEVDPRAELAERLAEYKHFRELAAKLKEGAGRAGLSFYREPGIPEEVAAYEPPKNAEELIGDLTADRLWEAFNDIMKRADDKTDPVRSSFGDIEKEEVGIEERMVYVEDYLRANPRTSFSILMEEGGRRDRRYLVVTFLAILELMRAGKMRAVQDGTFGEIYIEAGDI